MSEAWTKKQTKELISVYRKHPALYNSSHPEYTKKKKRMKLLKKVQEELKKVKPDVTVFAIRTKIKTLQNQLSKERIKMRRAIKNGQATEESYKHGLWCYKDLGFLSQTNDDTIKTPDREAEGDGEAKSSSSSDESDDENLTRPECDSEKPISYLPEIKKLYETAQTSLEVACKLIQENQNPTIKQNSKHQRFCQYLCKELEDLKCDETFEGVVVNILKLVRAAKTKEKALLKELVTSQVQETATTATVNLLEIPLCSSPESETVIFKELSNMNNVDTNWWDQLQ